MPLPGQRRRHLFAFDGGLDDGGAGLSQAQNGRDFSQFQSLFQMTTDTFTDTHFDTHYRPLAEPGFSVG